MRRLLAALVATALTLAATGMAAQATPDPGGAGIGDPYFPQYGNGGYDVSHYDIRLRYTPATDLLTGTTTILAAATHDLTNFNLDFLLDVESVQVNNRPATFARKGDHELVVTPARPIAEDGPMTVVVRYSGVPSSKVDAGLHNAAWIRTPDGAMAVGEPEIAWWWFPSNDHPSDKATFDVSVAVPDDLAAISNGDMAGFPLPEGLGYSRWSWRSLKPQATYLAFVAIGKYDLSLDTTANGQSIWNAYSQLLPQSARDAAEASIGRTAEITDWESTLFGPWPFEARGGVAAPPDVLGFALENQTRPTYSDAFWYAGANTSVIVHENAHQWFGDSVSLSRWQDIWLNEGFASYAEWLWSEKNNEGTAQDLFNYLYATNAAGTPFWTVAPAAPGVANLFSPAVYERGAMALHQLRRAVGDTDFFRILRAWTADHRYGNATTEQFTALAEKISGKDLEALFKAWLYAPSKPVLPKLAKAAPTAPKSWAQISRTHALLHEH